MSWCPKSVTPDPCDPCKQVPFLLCPLTLGAQGAYAGSGPTITSHPDLHILVDGVPLQIIPSVVIVDSTNYDSLADSTSWNGHWDTNAVPDPATPGNGIILLDRDAVIAIVGAPGGGGTVSIDGYQTPSDDPHSVRVTLFGMSTDLRWELIVPP
jgi:hypothetical protein